MRLLKQNLEDIVAALSPLPVDWMDQLASDAITMLTAMPIKNAYDRTDVITLLDHDFDTGFLCCRLFLALSKDQADATLRDKLGDGGIGVKRYLKEPDTFVAVLEEMGLLTAMAVSTNHRPVWSDIFVERLRSGRGSAISGQKSGLGLETFAEAVVKEVFGHDGYEMRASFKGVGGKVAKCDIAIPKRSEPLILIESKAYGATGSKMTDIIGDLDHIIEAKRHDAALLVLTDGITWKSRQSDLAKIISRQNDGRIQRIYTTSMRHKLLEDLQILKAELDL